MKTILPVISSRREGYQRHPFICFLGDSNRSAQERLSYAPYIGHFVSTFAEFNRTFLYSDNAALNKIQESVNIHAEEDARHCAWYLQDLRTLGYDRACTFTDALRFLWSDAGRHGRELGYAIISAVRGADPSVKLVAIEALESMGNVWLEATLTAAREHPARDKLIYFGQHHLDRETGHAIGSDRERILQVELSTQQRKQALAIINDFYDRMEAFNSELLRLVENTPAQAHQPNAAVDFMGLKPRGLPSSASTPR